MNKKDVQWVEICIEVARKMSEHTEPYATPISKALSYSAGELLGTGSYCEVSGRKYLVTNEHVAREANQIPLGHQFRNSDCVIRVTKAFLTVSLPIDVAITRIEDDNWIICKHDSRAIPMAAFDQKHQPVEGELLFFAGYSGERSKFYYEHLFSPGSPYVTQEIDCPKEHGKPDFHFALPYAPSFAYSTDGNTRGLPTPPGFSGSLVWNTKRIECLQMGKEWTPDCSRVTGIVWGWPSSSACILATRAERMGISELARMYRD